MLKQSNLSIRCPFSPTTFNIFRCPAAAASHHQRLQRLHHMAKSESALIAPAGQPSSLPNNILLSAVRGGGYIPRAPIPTPPPPSNHGRRRQRTAAARQSPSPPATDGDSVVHYEVLPGDRREHHRRGCHHHGGGSGGSGGRGHYSADNTFDSIEIPMGVGGASGHGVRPSEDDLHYKVLHDREGHYSYAYDTSLSPAFLIRSVHRTAIYS